MSPFQTHLLLLSSGWCWSLIMGIFPSVGERDLGVSLGCPDPTTRTEKDEGRKRGRVYLFSQRVTVHTPGRLLNYLKPSRSATWTQRDVASSRRRAVSDRCRTADDEGPIFSSRWSPTGYPRLTALC
jgi:hypothetical protein